MLIALLVSTHSLPASPLQEHRLQRYHTHTGERLDIVYRRGGTYVSDAIAKLDYFLCDHRTGDVRHFDPKIFDALEDLTIAVGHPDLTVTGPGIFDPPEGLVSGKIHA
ncbi:MAG TPA: DUF882 domain-containing protein [Verrucomicrobiae bacterium]|nr:DUF882 domain-containing protein [Verrucomicrobiae bacterium]